MKNQVLRNYFKPEFIKNLSLNLKE